MFRFVRRVIRLLFRLLLILVVVLGLTAVLFLLFPERGSIIVVRRFAPNVGYRVGNITWRKNGVDINNLILMMPGATVDLKRVSVFLQGGGKRGRRVTVDVDGGALDFTPARKTPAEREQPRRALRPLPVDKLPVRVAIRATNLTVRVALPGHDTPMTCTASLDAAIDRNVVTQLHLRAALRGARPWAASLNLRAWQAAADFGIEAAALDVDVAGLLEEFPRADEYTAEDGKLAGTFGITGTFGKEEPRIREARCDIEFSAARFGVDARRMSFSNVNMSGSIHLTQPLDIGKKPDDRISCLLEHWAGSLTASVAAVTLNDIEAHDIYAETHVLSARVDVAHLAMNVFGGSVDGSCILARRKVKGKRKWRFRYDVDIRANSLDAERFCDVFQFQRNRLDGRFKGHISTSVFGKWVKKLDGKLESEGGGVLIFPEAKKYVATMQDSMQKQLVDIMTERLTLYPYTSCSIELAYDRKAKTTNVNFLFLGTDRYFFSISYDRSWIEAMKLARMFQ